MRVPACLLLSVLLLGCLGAEAPPAEGETPPTPDFRRVEPILLVQVLHEGRGALRDEPLERVVEDEAALRALWDELQPTPMRPPPEVDFSHQRVVVVSLGNVGTFSGGDRTCDALRPGGVREAEDGAVVVAYVRVSPPEGQECRRLAEHPHVVLAIPHGGPVRFETRHETAPPPPPAPKDLPVFPMADDRDSPVPGPVERVFETEAEWLGFWGDVAPPEAWQTPAWGEHHVALVVLADRPNDCHRVDGAALDLDEATGRATLTYVEVVPAEGVRCNAGTTRPYAAWFYDPRGVEEVAFASRTRETHVDRPGPPVAVAHEILADATLQVPATRAEMWRFEQEREWLDFWDAHAPEGSEPPAVDFAQRRVVVISLGEPLGPCDRVRVDDVTRDSHLDSVEVRLTHLTGGEGCEPAPLQVATALERGGTVGYFATRVTE